MPPPDMDPREIAVLSHLVLLGMASGHPAFGAEASEVSVVLPAETADRVLAHLTILAMGGIQRRATTSTADRDGRVRVTLFTRMPGEGVADA